jgi:hypothetical protein
LLLLVLLLLWLQAMVAAVHCICLLLASGCLLWRRQFTYHILGRLLLLMVARSRTVLVRTRLLFRHAELLCCCSCCLLLAPGSYCHALFCARVCHWCGLLCFRQTRW